jgi:hypothetical protein
LCLLNIWKSIRNDMKPVMSHKLALTSPTSGGRSVGIVSSQTKATELVSDSGGKRTLIIELQIMNLLYKRSYFHCSYPFSCWCSGDDLYSCSDGPQFESRPSHRLSLPKFSWFSHSVQTNAKTSRLSHDHPLSHPTQYIFHQAVDLALYNLYTQSIAGNKLSFRSSNWMMSRGRRLTPSIERNYVPAALE